MELSFQIEVLFKRPNFIMNYFGPLCCRESLVDLQSNFLKNSQLTWTVKTQFENQRTSIVKFLNNSN